MIVLLDVDGVVANFIDPYLLNAAEVTGRVSGHDDVKDWDVGKAIGLTVDEEKQCDLLMRGAAAKLPEYPGAVDGVNALAAAFDVYFATSPFRHCPTWTYDRMEWLRSRFPWFRRQIVFTMHKELVRGDVLVDDSPKNCIGWKRANPNGIGILWDRPWNRSTRVFEHGLIRASEWEDVFQCLGMRHS